ncbi:carboxymuconolactone decarboxylase family protein [Actinoallomurus sp. NPDC052308]|uniref:carboxymuconolactone decarboxylase family protein n=1 Tax=Actinoallomurus sp. NPDC052308 TaxID=3155530 RepID=UPI0034146DB8
MSARVKTPAIVLPDATKAAEYVLRAIRQGGASHRVLELVHLRASQLNGGDAHVPTGTFSAGKAGQTDERRQHVGAWRDAPFYTGSERAALALTEAVVQVPDRPGQAVPDEIWDEAADHFDERQLAAIILMTATTAFLNRLPAATEGPGAGPLAAPVDPDAGSTSQHGDVTTKTSATQAASHGDHGERAERGD